MREDRTSERASGKEERPGSESGAYISAGTNCPIIHSVRRQRCSSAYPRPLLSSSFSGDAAFVRSFHRTREGRKKYIRENNIDQYGSSNMQNVSELLVADASISRLRDGSLQYLFDSKIILLTDE